MLSLDECINVVSRCMREVLGSDAVDARSAATTPFKELGLDSLGALDLCDKLVASTGLKLRPTVLFECPNADAVARRLLELQTAGADRVRDDVRGGREERRDERTRGLPMQPEFVRSELEEELARLEEVL
jgi:acyl carrier protein